MALKCRPKYFAERLVWCMKGLGTHDSDLIRVIVSRAEVCLKNNYVFGLKKPCIEDVIARLGNHHCQKSMFDYALFIHHERERNKVLSTVRFQ